MTAEELIAQSRQHMTQPRPGLTPTHLYECMHEILCLVLESVYYERNMSSPAAIVVRAIASICADLEDVRLQEEQP